MHKFTQYNESRAAFPKIDAMLVFLLLALTYAYFYELGSTWNENAHFGLTFAIVQEGRLTIDSFYNDPGTRTGDTSFYKGHYYSNKAPGTPIAAAALYFPIFFLVKLFNLSLKIGLIKLILTLIVIGIPSAFAGTLIYLMCKFISKDVLKAYIVTIAITLGTMCFPFSTAFFSHQLAATLLFVCFFMLFFLKINSSLYTKSYLFLIGLLLGFALIIEYTTALVVLPLIIYLFYISSNKSFRQVVLPLVFFTIGLSVFIIILLIYNKICWGNPFSISHQHLTNTLFAKHAEKGIFGVSHPKLTALYYITIHPAMGLFWQSPVLIMVFVGLYFMYATKEYRAEAVVVMAAFLLYLLMNAGYDMWWGGWSFGPRYVIPMLPFLCLPLIFVPGKLFFLTIILGFISIIQMFIVTASVVCVPHKMMFKISRSGYFEHSTIYSHCFNKLALGSFRANFGNMMLGLKGWASLIPIMLLSLSITIIFLMPSMQRFFAKQTK